MLTHYPVPPASIGAGAENRCTIDIGSNHRGSPDSVSVAVATVRHSNADRLVRARGRDNSHHRAPTSTNPYVIPEYQAALRRLAPLFKWPFVTTVRALPHVCQAVVFDRQQWCDPSDRETVRTTLPSTRDRRSEFHQCGHKAKSMPRRTLAGMGLISLKSRGARRLVHRVQDSEFRSGASNVQCGFVPGGLPDHRWRPAA